MQTQIKGGTMQALAGSAIKQIDREICQVQVCFSD